MTSVSPIGGGIRGELLDINYTNCMKENKTLLLKEASVFGLG